MNQSRFTGLLFSAALLLFLTSCGGNTSDETAGSDTTAADTAQTVALAPPNTIITTPENLLLIVHKVSNFEKWKVAYESHDSARLANGIHNYVLGRGFVDTNIVMVALKVDDIAKAKAFTKDPGLKKAMQKGGVVGAPTITFNTSVWQDTAIIDVKLRARTTFSVKDWEAWEKSFQEGNQERLDNGIVTRVVGHDPDDNKKVALVTAVTDTAKAFAYYKSDALKNRRIAGGVVGETNRFLFNIVKRY